MKKKDLLILIIPIIIVIIAYPFLPARIPRQFHFDGEPTSYMAKEFIFIFGVAPYLIYKYYQIRRG